MKILCFGDSNTWGYQSGSSRTEKRWPLLLSHKFESEGSDDVVFEAGKNGRTFDSGDESGLADFKKFIELYPCDVVIIALGLNDTKMHFGKSVTDIGVDAKTYVDLVPKRCILVSPPMLGEKTEWEDQFEDSREKLAQLPTLYSNLCETINGSDLEVGSDGVHLTEEAHEKLAQRVYEKLKE